MCLPAGSSLDPVVALNSSVASTFMDLSLMDTLTAEQSRYMIGDLVKQTTQRTKPLWDKAAAKPVWWPDHVPWGFVNIDPRPVEQRKEPWSMLLRDVIRACYAHYNCLSKFNGKISRLRHFG